MSTAGKIVLAVIILSVLGVAVVYMSKDGPGPDGNAGQDQQTGELRRFGGTAMPAQKADESVDQGQIVVSGDYLTEDQSPVLISNSRTVSATLNSDTVFARTTVTTPTEAFSAPATESTADVTAADFFRDLGLGSLIVTVHTYDTPSGDERMPGGSTITAVKIEYSVVTQ